MTNEGEQYMNHVNSLQSKRIRELLVLGLKKQREVDALTEEDTRLKKSLEVAYKEIDDLGDRIEKLNVSITYLKKDLSRVRVAEVNRQLKEMVGASFTENLQVRPGGVRPSATQSCDPKIFTLKAKHVDPPFSVLYQKAKEAEADRKREVNQEELKRLKADRAMWRASAERRLDNYEALRATHNALKREFIRAWAKYPHKLGWERLDHMCRDFQKELKHDRK